MDLFGHARGPFREIIGGGQDPDVATGGLPAVGGHAVTALIVVAVSRDLSITLNESSEKQ